MSRKEIAAFPYRLVKGELELVIVTNREGTRWILPKGKPEKHLADAEVALMEAYEEAGLICGLDERFNFCKKKYLRGDEKIKLLVYVLNVEEVQGRWPEDNIRKRKLVNVKTALRMVNKSVYRECIESLARKVTKKLLSG